VSLERISFIAMSPPVSNDLQASMLSSHCHLVTVDSLKTHQNWNLQWTLKCWLYQRVRCRFGSEFRSRFCRACMCRLFAVDSVANCIFCLTRWFRSRFHNDYANFVYVNDFAAHSIENLQLWLCRSFRSAGCYEMFYSCLC